MAQYIQKPMKKKAGFWDMFNWTAPYGSEAGSEMLEPLFKHKRVEPGSKAISRNGTILTRKQLDKITGADKLRAENKKLKGEVDFQTNRADDAEADRMFADVTRGNKKPGKPSGTSSSSAVDSAKDFFGRAYNGAVDFAKAHPVGTGIAGGALAALVISRIINGRKRRPKYAEAMTLKDRYSRGFATKCASAGVDPNALVKIAQRLDAKKLLKWVNDTALGRRSAVVDVPRINRSIQKLEPLAGTFAPAERVNKAIANLKRMRDISEATKVLNRTAIGTVKGDDLWASIKPGPVLGQPDKNTQNFVEFWQKVRDPEAFTAKFEHEVPNMNHGGWGSDRIEPYFDFLHGSQPGIKGRVKVLKDLWDETHPAK